MPECTHFPRRPCFSLNLNLKDAQTLWWKLHLSRHSPTQAVLDPSQSASVEQGPSPSNMIHILTKYCIFIRINEHVNCQHLELCADCHHYFLIDLCTQGGWGAPAWIEGHILIMRTPTRLDKFLDFKIFWNLKKSDLENPGVSKFSRDLLTVLT